MSTISITLDDDDISEAIMTWAVTCIMTEGKATKCELHVDASSGKASLVSATVSVETERMVKRRERMNNTTSNT